MATIPIRSGIPRCVPAPARLDAGPGGRAPPESDGQDPADPEDRHATTHSVDHLAHGHSSEPHLPHDRDESVGATGGIPSERVRQGHRDLERGLQDTSRAPEADRAYDRLKRKG